ncbi:MAG: hypothetical protein U0575_06715 [Phycisphaerales bacterium]
MPLHRSTSIARRSVAGALVFIAALGASASAQLPTYRVDILGPDLQGFGMNEHGDVTGRKLLAGSVGRAFVASLDGDVALLPLPAPWQSSDGYAINDLGVVAGAVASGTIASIGSHAAAWYPTPEGYEFVLLGALPGHDYSTATGVNNLGDIVGGSGGIGLGLYPSGVLFDPNGGPIELPGFGLVADVNNQRIALRSNTLIDLDTMATTTIPLPPGNWQGVQTGDLNNNDGFCGYIAGFSGCSTFPIMHLPGAGWDFLGGCATTTSAVSLNDQGDALTFVYNGGLGVVFIDGGYTDIASLIDPSEGTWIITGVSTINNARQMLVGGKRFPDLVAQLIRLTPIVIGDLDGDGRVDGADLGLLLAAWGGADANADLDGSGAVDGGDLGVLLAAWTG